MRRNGVLYGHKWQGTRPSTTKYLLRLNEQFKVTITEYGRRAQEEC